MPVNELLCYSKCATLSTALRLCPLKRGIRQIESHPPDLNRKPSAYEALALPIELGWRGV